LQQRYGGQGLQLVGIALDKAAAGAPFVAEKGVNYPVLFGDDQVIRLMQAFGNEIGGLPYTVIINAGEVVYRHQGEWHADDAQARLKALLDDS